MIGVFKVSKKDYTSLRNQRKYCVGLPREERRLIRSKVSVKRYQKEENKRFRLKCRHYVDKLEDYDNEAEPMEHGNVDELAYYRHLW